MKKLKNSSIKIINYYIASLISYTNSIENFFSVLKSKIQKMEGLKVEDLRNNIKKALSEISTDTYKNIIKGAYERNDKYVKTVKTKKKTPKIYK